MTAPTSQCVQGEAVAATRRPSLHVPESREQWFSGVCDSQLVTGLTTCLLATQGVLSISLRTAEVLLTPQLPMLLILFAALPSPFVSHIASPQVGNSPKGLTLVRVPIPWSRGWSFLAPYRGLRSGLHRLCQRKWNTCTGSISNMHRLLNRPCPRHTVRSGRASD